MKIRPEDRHFASRGLPSDDNGNPEGLTFLSHPHTTNGFFFLLTIKCRISMFKHGSHNVPEYAETRHDIMTSFYHNNGVT